jgi:hypothetical protein
MIALEGVLAGWPDSAASVGLEVLLFAALVWGLGLVSALLVPTLAATRRCDWKMDLGAANISGLLRVYMGIGAFSGWPPCWLNSPTRRRARIWLVVLLVLPAYSCIAYSIGMPRRGWRWRVSKK